ncbi:cyclic nucleotide-binding domain-containing protein [Rhizobium sullae]|uniref:Mechanosensitive ion channel family protein n=1 Tax=Rhizobium sullae TaxID=50338 RepID=A0A2N0DGT2_RHISU|nr:mechanosensitive ion channel family protein [Rhizobium sullae]PKA45321.1 small mechanosensitive ion channel [Rhizobium sullae]UWU17534.1 mechanosensitive ion channel family protein [Rhizobium sullae]
MLQGHLDKLASDPLAWLILLGLAGIVVWYLLSPRRANLRLVVQIAFFAAMTAALIESDISPGRFQDYRFEDTRAIFVIVAKLLWWLHLAWAIIGFVRIYLVLEGRPREARLLQDIVVGLVYLCVMLSALAFVFGVPIGTLVATSGVIAIVLGLALQNTLGDVFSGIALTLGRTYSLGDWILLADGTEGRVIASTWRSTHVLTVANNVVVLPNGVLAKLGLTNISQPDETHLLRMTVRVAPTRMPSIIEDVMQSVLAGCNSIVKEPPPQVALKGVDAVALEIELLFRVTSPSLRTQARNEVIDLFYRQCKSAGLLLAMPPSAIAFMNELPTEEGARPPEITPLSLIEAIPVFSHLTKSEKELLAQSSAVREFQKGEIIAHQGQTLPSLMIIRAGIVAMRNDEQEQRRLSPGDFFGETGLLAGMGEVCTLQALTPVTVYEIDQQSFAPLLEARPAIAEKIATTLAARADDVRHLPLPATGQERSARALLKAIRAIFRN